MKTKKKFISFHRLSVIVPLNPFSPDNLKKKKHCLCALDVIKLMEWWPGKPHAPNRNPSKRKMRDRH